MTRHRWLAPMAVIGLVVAACGGTTASRPRLHRAGPHPVPRRPRASATGDQRSRTSSTATCRAASSNAADNVPTAEAAQFLYDGIYEFDEGLTPVADLATDLAQISEDGLTWTVKLRSPASSSTTAPT